MFEFEATAQFFDSPAGWSLPSPTRSIVLGDPAAGFVYGCILELEDQAALSPGSAGHARVRVWSPEHPNLDLPIPLWYESIIGELRNCRAVKLP